MRCQICWQDMSIVERLWRNEHKPCGTNYDVDFIFLTLLINEPCWRDFLHLLRESRDVRKGQGFQKAIPWLRM